MVHLLVRHGGVGGEGGEAAATGAYVYGPKRMLVGEDGPEWILNTAQMAGILNGSAVGGSGGGGSDRIVEVKRL